MKRAKRPAKRQTPAISPPPASADASTTGCNGSTSISRTARPPSSAFATSTGSSLSILAFCRVLKMHALSRDVRLRMVFQISNFHRTHGATDDETMLKPKKPGNRRVFFAGC